MIMKNKLIELPELDQLEISNNVRRLILNVPSEFFLKDGSRTLTELESVLEQPIKSLLSSERFKLLAAHEYIKQLEEQVEYLKMRIK